ncbi:histidine phosphotransferase family protein [Microbaculum marinum]|uniref:Histidine phosphotransferase family protein n=1 Tax=Microbaculum marinum TaxID=1764581 RepID=A0AAW9RUY3_9HYPH
MSDTAPMSDLDLAALMCSKLCHDVISPVGAITNGFEVLEDETDESMREMALDIIRTNANKASTRLQFLRLAFGAMGATGDRFPLDDARSLTESLYEGERARIDWRAGAGSLPKDKVKLLVNLIVIAVSAIPRGGDVVVEVDQGGDAVDESVSISVRATGKLANMPDAVYTIFEGKMPPDGLDARSVQPYYAYRLSRSLGMTLKVKPVDGGVLMSAA